MHRPLSSCLNVLRLHLTHLIGMLVDCEVRSAAQVLSQLQATRGYAAKEVRFGVDCRSGVLAGVDRLADAVQVTLGPKVGIHSVQRPNLAC